VYFILCGFFEVSVFIYRIERSEYSEGIKITVSPLFPEKTLTNKYMPVITSNFGFQGENAL